MLASFRGAGTLAGVAERFPPERVAALDEVHTASGAHRTMEIPFPDWVPAEDLSAAALLTVDEALAQLPACLTEPGST